MVPRPYPRSFAHVGLTVPDIEAAVEWYTDVLGWTHLKGPRSVRGNEGFGGKRATDLLGEFEEMRVAQLVSGNGVGVEFFEFTPNDVVESTDPKRAGFSHICVVDPDVKELAKTIEEEGGRHHTHIWRLYEGVPDYTLTYCEDPFGNLIEVYSHSHEQMHAEASRLE